jgi:NADPH-dependent 2,4-dienoyl-CoA reductase/sulfur reductase-like enzyme
MTRIVVVGAGPAGVAAAALLAERGAQVTLIEERSQPGGQVWRAPAPGLALDMGRLLGTEEAGYRRFHAMFAALRPRIDWRPDTLVWNVHGGAVQILSGGTQQALPHDALLLATGATDRIAPLPGWTLPGVFALGGAQAVLKDQGCLIGQTVVFCGSSPLLYLAAVQYARFGAVVTVLDTTPLGAKLAAAGALAASAPWMLARGLGLMAALRRQGRPIHLGVTLLGFEGEAGVAAVRWRDARGVEQRTSCDAAAYGHGLRPESQLAEIAGAAMEYDRLRRFDAPAADAMGRCGNGLYVAGDGAAIGGAEAAEVSGRLAAMALLADRGESVEFGALPQRLARLRRFQDALAHAFAWPHAQVAALDDDVPVCRCEQITAGEVRAVLAPALGAAEVNRMKAATRCGMGRCQGRYCGHAAAEITAAALGSAGAPLDRLRAQPPVKPLPVASARVEDDWP